MNLPTIDALVKADPSNQSEKIKCKSLVLDDNKARNGGQPQTCCKFSTTDNNNEAGDSCDQPKFF